MYLKSLGDARPQNVTRGEFRGVRPARIATLGARVCTPKQG